MKCLYFLLCDRAADGFIDHPVLGLVPTCSRCAHQVGLGDALIPEEDII